MMVLVDGLVPTSQEPISIVGWMLAVGIGASIWGLIVVSLL